MRLLPGMYWGFRWNILTVTSVRWGWLAAHFRGPRRPTRGRYCHPIPRTRAGATCPLRLQQTLVPRLPLAMVAGFFPVTSCAEFLALKVLTAVRGSQASPTNTIAYTDCVARPVIWDWMQRPISGRERSLETRYGRLP